MPENQASTPELLVPSTAATADATPDRGPAARRDPPGRLVAGERLPASRALATDLGVSRGVVSDAYMQLAAEGYLLVAPRTSPRVAHIRGQTPHPALARESAQARAPVKGSDP